MIAPAQGSSRVSPLKVLFASTSLLLFVFLMAHIFTVRPGHDQSWLLYAAQRVLSGIQPYGPQLSETNPPLIIWLSILPILLARFLHIEPITALRLVVTLLIFGSVAWCIRLLRRSPLVIDRSFPVLFGCAALLAELSSGFFNFGQREHIFVVFALPYILAVATGANVRLSVTERCALGFAAGIGVCLKPQELLVLIAFELFLAISRRSLRRILSPEFIAFVLTGLLYLAVMRVFAPRYQTETVPILLHTYWAFGSIGAMHLALTYKATTLSIFVTLFACYALRRHLKGLYILFALLTCAIGASIAYDIQNKDWYYHLLPCRQFVMLALSWLVLELALPLYRKHAVNLRLSMLAASALVLVELVTLTANLRATSVSRAPVHPKTLDLLLSQYPPSTTVYIFSTSVMPFGSVVSHDLNWGSRFAHLWMLPAIVQNEQPPVPLPAGFKYLPPDTLASLATLQRTESAEDLNRWKPDVVIVEHCTPTHLCQGLEDRNFDFLSWFLQSPDFAAAWSPYKRQPGPPLYDVYFRTH